MPINQNEIVDLLFKKVAYSASKTNTELGRAPSEEPIPSPVSTFGNYIWLAAGSIPTNPPTSDTAIVERRQDSGYVELTRNTDVANNRSWIAQESANGTTTSLRDWIPPIFGAQYGIKVWTGTPGAGGAARIYPKGSGQDDEFYFDYDAGTLHFIGNTVPVTSGTQISIEGYRYIGSTDIGTVSAAKLNDLIDVGIESGSVDLDDGQVLVYDLALETWINGPIPSGALSGFNIVNPSEGEVLVFSPPGGGDKFENKLLNYIYVDGLPAITGEDFGSFVQVSAAGTGDQGQFEYTSLTDLYQPGDLIQISGNYINHKPAEDPQVYTGTATGADILVTNVSSGEDQEDQGWYPAYRDNPSLYLMKTCELDEKGHVIAREWTNISNQLDQYTTLSAYNARWNLHETQQEHNLWLHIDGVSTDFSTGNFDNKLLVKQGDDLSPIVHSGIVIGNVGGSLGVTEIHATHLLDVPVFFGTPQDGESLVYSGANSRWESLGIGDLGEANEGSSLTSADPDAFDIFKQKDDVTLTFRGLKLLDLNDVAITDHTYTWNDGVDPLVPYPLTAEESDNRIDIKFDPSKIRIYQLTDQMIPGAIGHSTFQLAYLRDNPLTNNSIYKKQYDKGWFSYDPLLSTHVTDEPNRMSHAQWGALQGGGGQGEDSRSRRLRTSSNRYYLAAGGVTDPLSIQQQIDDKVQYQFFKGHITAGGAEEIVDPNFGGYHSNEEEYGSPAEVTTTTGDTNPIYKGSYQAHESKSIIFRANAISHYNQAAYGNIFDHTVASTSGDVDWFEQGITPWQQTGGQHLRYHTVRSVVSKHINTHINNPHGVLFSDVENDVAHWNANQLLGEDIQFSTLGNNQVLLWDDINQKWFNSDILATTGESNAAENIGGGVSPETWGEFFSSKAGATLQFRSLESVSSSLTVATEESQDRVTIDFTLPAIDIDSLVGWPINFEDTDTAGRVLSTLTDVDTVGVSDNQLLIYDANVAKWRPGNPGLTGVDLTGVEEGDYLIAEEVVPNVTPAEFKWVRSPKYTIGGSLAGVADQNGDRTFKPFAVDYTAIGNNHVLAYNSGSQRWEAQALGAGFGESNLLSDYVIEGTVTGAVGLTATPSKGGTTLYVKSVKDSPTVEVDTNISTGKIIALKINEGNVLLDNLGGALDPSRIVPINTVTSVAFSGLEGYDVDNKGTINAAIDALQLLITGLETNKANDADLNTHVNINAGLRYASYGSADDPSLKHQPYEVGSGLPEFNANKLAYAPLHADLITGDETALGLGNAGKYLQWDGSAWDIGGGGEVSEGVHTQFAFYHAVDPASNTTTQRLKPTGSEFVFIQTPGEEARLGVQTIDPPEVFSIAGDRPCIATEQIYNTNQEPDVSPGWGKLYGRVSVGGIVFETKVVLHFDGVDGGNSFLNDGRAPVYFLPKHDYDDGSGEVYNQVATETDKYIFGNSCGYFPAPTGSNVGTNYLAGNAHDDIILAEKPFGFDFWMYSTDPNGTQKITGQYDDADNYWFIAINFDTNPNQIEFEYKSGLTTSTRTLTVPGAGTFVANNWYHIIIQRHPEVVNTVPMDTWDLLVSPASYQQTGAPSVPSTGEGLQHGVTNLDKPIINIGELQGHLIVGNGNREGTDLGFVGYMDEFRMYVGHHTEYSGSDFRTFLLPYDTENSSLIYKDSKGEHNLLNAGAIIRRLRDQDGNTTVDVDKDDLNDDHIRFSANGVQVATFSQDGLTLAGSTPVTRVENNLNNNYDYALVTQKAVKDAIDDISGDSIQDAAGTTYIRTEQGSQDETIRMAVDSDEKLAINADGVDLKAKLYLDSVAPAAGQMLEAGSNQKLTWVNPLNVATGTTKTLATYTNNGKDIGPATGVSWDLTADTLDIDGDIKAEILLVENRTSHPAVVSDHIEIYSIEGSEGQPITSDIKLLLQGNAAHGSASILDSSSASHTINIGGGAVIEAGGTINNGRGAFGNSCIKLDGTDSYLTIPASTDFKPGTNFTIDWWAYVPSGLTGGQILGYRGGSNQEKGFILFNVTTGKINWGWSSSTGGWTPNPPTSDAATIENASGSFPEDQWVHYALVKTGTYYEAFVDGVSIGTKVFGNTWPSAWGSYDARIGISTSHGGTNAYSEFYFDELRITPDVAIDFGTLGVPTAQLGGTVVPDSLYAQDPTGNRTQLTGVASGWTDATSGVVKLSDSTDIIELGEKVDASALPTSAPTTAGRLWNDSGTLKITS